MPKIKVNDINIYYETHGTGYPLVMICGASMNVDWWDPALVDLLSKHFTTVIFDNRGVGKTDDTNLDYTVKTLADDTVGLLDALNLEQVHLFGISFGGSILQEIALSYPLRVNKLILCSTQCMGRNTVFQSPEVMEIIIRTNLAFNSEKQIRELMPLVLTEEYIKNKNKAMEDFIQIILKNPLSEQSAKRQSLASAKFRSCKRLSKIKAKTLVIHGKKDILVVPENAEVLANLIPDTKLILFEKSAHSIYAEEPELFKKVILDFLL